MVKKMKEKVSERSTPGRGGEKGNDTKTVENIALEGTHTDMGQTNTTSEMTSGEGRYVKNWVFFSADKSLNTILSSCFYLLQ